MQPTLLLSLTLLLLSQTATYAKTFELEWFLPMSPADVFPNATASVGDRVSFTWTQELDHNVYIHPSADCDQTGAILVGSNFEDTEYKFKEEDAGKVITFACDVLLHCQQMQIVHFTVMGEGGNGGGGGSGAGDGSGRGDGSGGGDAPMSSPAATPTASGAMLRGDGVRQVAIATILAVVSLCITLC